MSALRVSAFGFVAPIWLLSFRVRFRRSLPVSKRIQGGDLKDSNSP